MGSFTRTASQSRFVYGLRLKSNGQPQAIQYIQECNTNGAVIRYTALRLVATPEGNGISIEIEGTYQARQGHVNLIGNHTTLKGALTDMAFNVTKLTNKRTFFYS